MQVFADGEGRFELPRPYRRVLVYARDGSGKLAGFVMVGENNDAELTIVVQPAAIGRGQVVDGAGVPYDHVRVRYSVWPNGLVVDGFEGATQWIVTDEQGRFTAGGLPVGTRCDVGATRGGGRSRKKDIVEIKDPRPIDFGDVIMHPR